MNKTEGGQVRGHMCRGSYRQRKGLTGSGQAFSLMTSRGRTTLVFLMIRTWERGWHSGSYSSCLAMKSVATCTNLSTSGPASLAQPWPIPSKGSRWALPPAPL